MAGLAEMDPCCPRACDVFPGEIRALVPQFPPSGTWRWDRCSYAANKPVRDWAGGQGLSEGHFSLTTSIGGSMAVRVVFEQGPGMKTTGIAIRRLAPPQRRSPDCQHRNEALNLYIGLINIGSKGFKEDVLYRSN